MPDSNDMELLRDYRQHGSEKAFATLVERHINLVYSTALRHVGVAAQAEEITQVVFIILARKAAGLRTNTILESWLYETTLLTALSFRRGEWRRQLREQEAYMQSTMPEADENSIWNQLAPLLDDALARLARKDREAVVLRFFKEKDTREVAAALKITEAAAQKRVHRAVEKLREIFIKQGVALTATAIVGSISANSVQAAPVAMVKTISAVAVSKGAATASTLTLVKGALKIMAWSKMKTAMITSVVVLLAAATTTMMVTKIQSSSLDAYLQDPELNDISNAPSIVAIQSTHFSKAKVNYGEILGKTDGTKEIGRNISLSTALAKAYKAPSFVRMVFPEDLHRIKVDYLVTVPDHPRERFQAEIKRKFGWTAHVETRTTDVFVLKLGRPNAPGLLPADNSSWEEWAAKHPHSRFGMFRHNITLSKFAELMEGLAQKPVIDQTGLTGNYDFATGSFTPETMKQVILNQLGLELVSTNMPVEMLVVERAK